MALQYKDLQPWVDMLIDALENRGSSSSGIPDLSVYPHAEKFREILQQIREKKISKYHLDQFLNHSYDTIISQTKQKHRLKCLLEAIKMYFYKEFIK